VARKKRRHFPIHRPAVETVRHGGDDKGGKEYRGDSRFRLSTHKTGTELEETAHDKKGPGDRDRDRHKRRDDPGVTRDWRPVKQPGMRCLRTECKGGERVHDDVYPEDLNNGKRLRVPEKGCSKDEDADAEVDGELEDEETLDILVQRPAPPYCA